jgi:hypothetical protein
VNSPKKQLRSIRGSDSLEGAPQVAPMKTTPSVDDNHFELRDERSLQSVWDVVGMLIAAAIMFCMIVSGLMPGGQ